MIVDYSPTPPISGRGWKVEGLKPNAEPGIRCGLDGLLLIRPSGTGQVRGCVEILCQMLMRMLLSVTISLPDSGGSTGLYVGGAAQAPGGMRKVL